MRLIQRLTPLHDGSMPLLRPRWRRSSCAALRVARDRAAMRAPVPHREFRISSRRRAVGCDVNSESSYSSALEIMARSAPAELAADPGSRLAAGFRRRGR